MKKTLAALAWVAFLPLAAQTQLFRGGEILKAELSKAEPDVTTFDAELFPDLPERRIYAALTIALPPGRKIGIFDYRLVVFGHEYPCIALRTDGGKWRCTDKTVEGGKNVSLLFVLNRGTVGLDKKEEILLRCIAPASVPEAAQWKVVFDNLGEQPFPR